MILNTLTLTNFGTFAGTQTLDLTPPDREHPIVLVGGLNGAGKTTVLEAIQLALYGPLMQTTARGKGSYDNYLRGLIHRGPDVEEGAAVELEFTAYQQGEERRYWIRRSWKPAGASLRTILLVSVNGRHDRVLTETWQEYVETFLPRGIAGLFFFDGEQIEALASGERSREVLRSALDALLGLDLVTRLSTDLGVLRRRQQTEQLSPEATTAVTELEAAVTDARKAEDAATQAVARLRNDAERARTSYQRADEAYRAAGGQLAEKRADAELAAEQSIAHRTFVEGELRATLSGEAPLLLVWDALRDLREQALTESQATQDELLLSALDERDATVLSWLGEIGAHGDVVAELRGRLDSDRAGRVRRTTTESFTGVRDTDGLTALVTHSLPTAQARIHELLETHQTAVTAVDEAEARLVSIPHPDAIAPVVTAREEASAALGRADSALSVAEDAAQRAALDRERATASHLKAIEQMSSADLAADDGRRIVDHVTRAQETLDRVRVAATRRQLNRISSLIHEALQVLLRKDKLITEVSIDAETTSVQLLGSDGSPLPSSDLSAGERQLLAVSLLWGLARAAGQPLPVVIDTPLGRLDRSHRGRLLERYFPNASHQVILLSTDTEINERSHEQLSPFIGREYRLEFDAATSSTSVASGYFWEER
ncbi:DNA sulfur modification protein DndD [Microbacterium sp. NPDC090225]|uniref:DNA sulfur modification protein DndD n=1 Tax=Microbacterium sp. NPDC090225 TaxID=3364207 RepID=UPI00380A5B9A